MLVDDDPVTNLINKKLIGRNPNFIVTAHTSALDALIVLKESKTSTPQNVPDAIFLDINMFVMDGWEFLENFKMLDDRTFAKCKIFMLSSSIDLDDIEKSKTYTSVRDFISKPLTPDKIKMLIGSESSVAI